jgi:D-serine dehydratase
VTAGPADLLDPWLHPGLKGWPADAPPTRASAVGMLGWHLLDGTLPLPLATLDDAALARNLGWMQRLVDRAGVGLAPHGKTTMSPQLFRAQLDAGAWGLTVANAHQLDLAVAAGARRVLIANQVLQAADRRRIDTLRHAHPGLWVGAWLDSPEQLHALEAHPSDTPLDVLLELGLPGGRTGLRDDAAALALARQARASTAVRLAGLACYEGLWSTGDDTADRALVQGLTHRLQALAQHLEDEALFETDTVVVTAGGSAVFDLVAPALKLALRRPVQGVLRSGCYLTHDDGFYQRMGHAAGCSRCPSRGWRS